MKKFNSYDNVEVIKAQEALPVGGYVLRILDAKEVTYTWGSVLVLSFDICDGPYTGYYKKNYEAQTQENKKWKGTFRMNVPKDDGTDIDEWTARKFKTNIHAIEDSNPGYAWNWDEKSLVHKYVGAVFNNKEYEVDGRRGFYTNCHSLKTVEDIRNGNYKIPGDTLLQVKAEDNAFPRSDFAPANDAFAFAAAADEGNLPF